MRNPSIRTKLMDFNPRSREGSDADVIYRVQTGADFNPRSREGSDPGCFHRDRPAWISIHAPARGATQGYICTYHHPNNFNPRSREGSDSVRSCSCTRFTISIHAPARGATRSLKTDLTKNGVFQSTLPRGERPPTAPRRISNSRFQSTLPRGERLTAADVYKPEN